MWFAGLFDQDAGGIFKGVEEDFLGVAEKSSGTGTPDVGAGVAVQRCSAVHEHTAVVCPFDVIDGGAVHSIIGSVKCFALGTNKTDSIHPVP